MGGTARGRKRSAAASSGGTKRHKLSEVGDSLYETPAVAIEALIKNVRLPECVWEPACGPGSIARTLREIGHVVYATDLVDYDTPEQDEARWDFLMETQMPIGATAIVTNPPFKLAEQFVEHALDISPNVYMLLRLGFLAGSKPRRRAILDGGRLREILVFRKRLPMMHRAGWTGRKASSSIDFAWFCWGPNEYGDTFAKRIDY